MDENSHKFRRWRNKLCSRRISRLDHRTYRGSLQVGTREAAGRLWWNCRWWDRLATFSKLPNSKTAGLLWKGVPSWRWQIFEVNVRKNFPNPFCSFSWADGHDMRLSKKGCVWYFAHDKRRISPNDLRRHNVKISAWLLPEHHLW